MPQIINWNIAKNPINYLIVGTMFLIGVLAISILSSPLRAAPAA